MSAPEDPPATAQDAEVAGAAAGEDPGRLHDQFVDRLVRAVPILSRPIEQAFRRVPRHALVGAFWRHAPEEGGPQGPDGPQGQAGPHRPHGPYGSRRDWVRTEASDPSALGVIYSDEVLVTRIDADGHPTSSSSMPGLMAMMLEALDVRPGMRVLEIGAGTGYNAALLAELVGPSGLVVSLDIQDDVVRETAERLAAAGYGDVVVAQGDGAEGYQQLAPFDRVIATVGCPDVSWNWAEQLRGDGLLLVPLEVGGLHPIVRLVPGPGPGRLTGGVTNWSGFMPLQGRLHRQMAREPLARSEEPPSRTIALADLAGDPSDPVLDRTAVRRDLFGFLALGDDRTVLDLTGSGRASIDSDSFGLAGPKGGWLVRVTAAQVEIWDEDAADLFGSVFRRWVALGRPGVSDWQVTLTPRSVAEGAEPGPREVVRPLIESVMRVAFSG